ncbi:MAG: C25 family cysteine peptidase [Saprospiraceae bacterium]
MSISFETTRKLPDRQLLFVVPQTHRADFAELVLAWHAHGIAVEVLEYGEERPDVVELAARRAPLDAVLLAGPARFAPSTVLPGPIVHNAEGRAIPAAWFPIKSREANLRFAATAARVHRRGRQTSSVALLGQWHPRYLRLADRIETILQKDLPTFRWTGERIGRDEVVAALGAGLGLALYVGHGRPAGWVGYYGLRSHHFDTFDGEPLGGMLSLCCLTASRRRNGLSYAEALPLRGVTAASFGAVKPTLHTDNTRWAVRICEALTSGAQSLGELIASAAPPNPSAVLPYRLIGDPLAPLCAEKAGAQKAARVKVYP